MVIADLFCRLGLKVDRRSWQVGSNLIGGIGKMLAALAGAAVVAKIGSTIKEVTDLGGRLNDVSKQTNLSAESLQELGFAAEQSGTNFETLLGGLKRFAHGAQEAFSSGKGPAADGL